MADVQECPLPQALKESYKWVRNFIDSNGHSVKCANFPGPSKMLSVHCSDITSSSLEVGHLPTWPKVA